MPADPKTIPTNKKIMWLLPPAVFFIVWAAYRTSLSSFLHGDDFVLIYYGKAYNSFHAIASFFTSLHGKNYYRPVEIALQAADSASGLITACALVKGGRLSDVTVKTVTKKAKEKSFAAGCDRSRIALIAPILALPEFYAVAIDGLMGIRGELGLT